MVKASKNGVEARKASAWLWRAPCEHFPRDYLLPADEHDRTLACPCSGDGLLLVDGAYAPGIRRIYLVRHIHGGLRFYFDRLVDFAEPLPLSRNDVKSSSDCFVAGWEPSVKHREMDKFAHALQLNNLPDFEELPSRDGFRRQPRAGHRGGAAFAMAIRRLLQDT